ncbi:hypothetical protein ESCO_005845 [Escovopsis weberi]|uniref:Secreted protein n=1 Tax=Escovopsis weberi TaxID=150374 RepID=A0A0M8MUF3_ESCWE|nr:hypothetical protein ESCO_005845 [Escovopsis weberi]
MQLTSLISGTALVAAAAVQADLQINYYSDNGCHNYQGQVNVNWATTIWGGQKNCYNYQFGTSANIANCDTGNCLCNFFFNQGCTGSSFQTTYGNGGSNCMTAIGSYKSFACYYT